mmetsp:Transcript_1899/g.2038  ORF Transcript_1899/g.2038 Transcript_1899/m.2038 type:complete len:415 (+) Transcript_1899:97-1341(+)
MILKTLNCLLLSGVAIASAEKTVRNSTNIPSTVNGTYQIGPTYDFPEAIYPCDDCEKGDFFKFVMPIENTSYNCEPIDNPSLQDLTGTDACIDDETWDCNCADSFCGGPTDERGIVVYVPAAYKYNPDDAEIGVLVMQDWINPSYIPINSTYYDYFSWFEAVTNVMDRFMMSKDDDPSLPPFVLVGVATAGPGVASQDNTTCKNNPGTERFNEYVTVSDTYAKFISDEVLPYIKNHPNFTEKYPNLKFTNDPEGRGAIGTSDGGSTAIKMSFFTPELFGISIGYNAGILNHYDTTITSKDEYPLDMGELWQSGGMELIENSDKKPIRIFHSACDRDMGTENACIRIGPNPDDKWNTVNTSMYKDMGFDEFNFLVANNVTEELLVSKGYATRYAYTDWIVVTVMIICSYRIYPIP